MSKHVMMMAALAAVLAAGIGASLAQSSAPVSPAPVSAELVEAYVQRTWSKPAAGWEPRVAQDEAQRLCTLHKNDLPKEEYAKAIARELATVVLPADGKLLGDWKAGEKVAQTGTGGQFSDRAETPRGGNCYACHQMAPKELSYGTLGPSLIDYGKIRGYSADDAKAAYTKIYNAQAVLPCSNMPRFGYHKFLTEQQMKDVTAYLFDPESPVNKR